MPYGEALGYRRHRGCYVGPVQADCWLASLSLPELRVQRYQLGIEVLVDLRRYIEESEIDWCMSEREQPLLHEQLVFGRHIGMVGNCDLVKHLFDGHVLRQCLHDLCQMRTSDLETEAVE